MVVVAFQKLAAFIPVVVQKPRKEVIPKEVDVISIRRQIAQMMVATVYVNHKEERATLQELFCSNSGSNKNDC